MHLSSVWSHPGLNHEMVPVHVCPSCHRYLSSSRIFLRDRAPCRSFAYHPAPLRIRSFTPLMLAYYYWIWLLRRCIAVLRRVILAAHQKHHAADHFPLATTQRGHGRPSHMGNKQDTAPLFWPLNLRSIHASLCPGHDIFSSAEVRDNILGTIVPKCAISNLRARLHSQLRRSSSLEMCHNRIRVVRVVC